VWVAGPGATSILLGYAVGTLIAMTPFLRRQEAASSPDFRWRQETVRSLRRFARPLLYSSLLSWAGALGDRYILAAFHGAAEAGVYAASYGLASQPFITVGAICAGVLRPVLFDAVARGDRTGERQAIRRWLTVAGAISAAGLAATTLLSSHLVRWFLGTDFWPGAKLLPWIAATYALQNVQQAFENELYAQKLTRQVLAVQSIGTGAALVLYLVLIPRYGAIGAAVGSFLSMLTSCLASYGLVHVRRRSG
jgi:O-antigen/teichoic acid export membrane protein